MGGGREVNTMNNLADPGRTKHCTSVNLRDWFHFHGNNMFTKLEI